MSSCPYFRNEIGGENVWKIELSRRQDTLQNTSSQSSAASSSSLRHTPLLARGVSLLDTMDSRWNSSGGYCPYKIVQKDVIERIDRGATFYKDFFYGRGKTKIWTGLLMFSRKLCYRSEL